MFRLLHVYTRLCGTACSWCSLRCRVVFVQARSWYTERFTLTRILRSWSYERNNISGIYWVMVLMWIGHYYINQSLHQYVLRYVAASWSIFRGVLGIQFSSKKDSLFLSIINFYWSWSQCVHRSSVWTFNFILNH